MDSARILVSQFLPKMFEISNGATKVCLISLADVETSQDIAPIKAEFSTDNKDLINEFRYYYCTTPGSFGKCMGDALAKSPPNWGLSDFDNLEKILTNFPKPWRVKVGDRPKHDPFIPPDNGAIY